MVGTKIGRRVGEGGRGLGAIDWSSECVDKWVIISHAKVIILYIFLLVHQLSDQQVSLLGPPTHVSHASLSLKTLPVSDQAKALGIQVGERRRIVHGQISGCHKRRIDRRPCRRVGHFWQSRGKDTRVRSA